MGRLDGRVSVVTGGGRGLGRAIALALAAEGAPVVVAGRAPGTLDAVVAEIAGRGGDAFGVPTDVTDEASVGALVAAVMARHGRIDVLVNNAGAIVRKPTLEAAAEDWRHVLDVNLTGTYLCAVAAARHMVAAGSGKIINLSSVSATHGRADMAAYCAAKAGVIALTRSLALEWGPLGLHVNAIAPGQFDTDMGAPIVRNAAVRDKLIARLPLRRIGQPQEIGPLAVFLASAESDMITGETIFIDAGANVL